MKIEELYQCFLQCGSIATDTRNIPANALFFALKGANFDANTLAQEALIKGAAFVVMDNKTLLTNPEKMFYVTDALETLQQLAQFHRQQLGLPIIALTGSNGKTTTKELLLAVLSKKYQTKATLGNLNNHIGVPLTLLSFDEYTDIGIVEMGANHLGEIAQLCEIAQPDFGYITNFGKAHLEGFGSLEGVIQAKSELYDYLEDHHKMAFVNTEDARQDAKTITFSRYCFGTENDNDLVIQSYSAQPMAVIEAENCRFESQLSGLYNATNVAAAVAVGQYFQVEIPAIQQAIATYTPTNNRSQWIDAGPHRVFLDAYNANPSSMEAALSHFLQLESPLKKVLILGDMFELGTASAEEHQKLVENLKDHSAIQVFFVGKNFFEFSTKSNHLTFLQSYTELQAHLVQSPLPNPSLILVKGSRGMALEQIISHL